MFGEDDFILSLSTQDLDGTRLAEENVTFSQPAAPVFSQESFDVFDFPTQMFEEFVDDGIFEMFGFDDEGILDFVDDSIDMFSGYESALLETLINKECTLDDLNVNAKGEGTYRGTFTAVRSLNRFWNDHPFNPDCEPTLCTLRYRFQSKDGFAALCTMFHDERNILLAHYVVKLVPTFKKKDMKGNILGRTKRVYLNGIQRGLKLYEKQHNQVWRFGRDWCWSRDIEYQQLRAALDQSIIANEFGNIKARSLSIMSLEQFRALHQLTWEFANDISLPFSIRMTHYQRYLMQGILAFGCLRAREDLAECRVDEFEVISPEKIEFGMKRTFKSHKITTEKKVVHKPSRYILGKRYVHVLTLILEHRPHFDESKSAQLPTSDLVPTQPGVRTKKTKKPFNKKIQTPVHLRLWLKLVPDCVETDRVYFLKRQLGEKKVSEAVTAYIPILQETNSLFSDTNQQFTNTSLRKYHNDALSEAGAPIIVQQESLAQNTRAYAKNDSHFRNKDKVAEIVAGTRQHWHSPLQATHTPLQQNISFSSGKGPLKKRKVFQLPTNSNEQENTTPAVSSTGKHFTLQFSSGETSFSFQGFF